MTYEERKHWLCQQCDRQRQCGYANRSLQDKCPSLQECMQGWELGHQDATERAVEFIYAQNLVVQNIEELINELKKYMEEQK